MRKLMIFVLILLVLVVGADFAGRAIAESKAGEAIANESGISPAPEVDIHGFSFLWQAVDGSYSNISLSSNNLTVGGLTGVTAVAELYDVSLELSDVFAGDIDKMTAGRIGLNLRIPPAALTAALDVPNLTITGGDNGALRVQTSLEALGQSAPVTLELTPTVTGGVLKLGQAKVIDAPAEIPDSVVAPLLQQFTVDLPLQGLPFTLTDADATVIGGELVVTATAVDIPLGDLVAR